MMMMLKPNTPKRWANFNLERPLVMGILNVTPDSFSGHAHGLDRDAAIAAGLTMAAEGADIVDVGGESTRPGAAPVAPEVERQRVIPVIEALAAAKLCISVDTRNAGTMAAALRAGAQIINDVSALTHDAASTGVVAEGGCPVVLMHMRGAFATMYAKANYSDVAVEVRDEIAVLADAAMSAGVRPEKLAVDPGIGFAKRAEHSVAALRGLAEIAGLGYPVLVGASRKSFIGDVVDEPDPARRLGGSIAAGLFALSQGASILRVHDVRETVQAIKLWHELFDRETVSLS
jgi:dihydropteroate synthase